MSEIVKLAPSAAALSSSMRDLGYSIETAIADIVDNSITASASKVEIFYDPRLDDPALAIVDDGHGMTRRELIQAMRHGARVVREDPPSVDLGRFGLGLKTASLSQCRNLTVVSAVNGKRCAIEWDLDLVDEWDDWVVVELDDEAISRLPYIDALSPSGTVVIWRKLDRLLPKRPSEGGSPPPFQELNQVSDHLSLVFHRFLAPVKSPQLKISVNHHPLEPLDPYFESNKATQVLPLERIRIGNHVVSMQAFVLPHHSRLSAKEKSKFKTASEYSAAQGAYIYRNQRLLTWGDWFRVIAKSEATRHVRVRIDFESSMDELWTIDIKKSRAVPPTEVRAALKRIIDKLYQRSVNIHKNRGQRLSQDIRVPLWERFAHDGTIRYAVNHSHPLVGIVIEALPPGQSDKVNLLIDAIERTLPVESIYADFADSRQAMDEYIAKGDQIETLIRRVRCALFGGGEVVPDLLRQVVRSLGVSVEEAEPIIQTVIRESRECTCTASQ
ncbi:MAG: ATP-binding protein [Acidimicrobiia bacterium]